MHRLHISTLDSFYAKIARSFSLELELPAGWQIVNEITERNLRAEAIRILLQNESTDDVLKLMHLLSKGEASRSVSEQIAGQVDALYEIYLEAPENAWHMLQRKKQLSSSELMAAIEVLTTTSLPTDKRFQNAREKDLANAREANWGAFLSQGLGAKIIEGTLLYYNKPIPTDLVHAYAPLLSHAKAVIISQIADQTEATCQLLKCFDVVYQPIKFSRRAMRFEDLTRKLGDAVLADRMDDVIYRLDRNISHILLDEFQDTAPLQWRVLRPFVQRKQLKSFFCVGDVKQAIYGWRGGVAEIFEAIDEELDGIESQSLNQSWRSSPILLDCVNTVFENIDANLVLQNHPEAAKKWSARYERHTTAYPERSGYCRLASAPRAGQDEKQNVVTLRYAAGEIAKIQGRMPEFTIGVLVRKNDAVARLIYELRSLYIQASEEGGNPLTDSPAVELVLSLLKLADHPGDTAARFHLANSPLAARLGLSDYNNSETVWGISQNIRQKLMTDGYGLVMYNLTKELAPACNPRDLSRLMQLVELAYTYENQATTRADDFVSLVENQKVADPQSTGVRVMTYHQAKGLQFDIVFLPELDVKLTGQTPEFVVEREKATGPIRSICRYVSTELRSLLPDSYRQMHDDYKRRVVEESLCILYVAMTRAKYALHMIVSPSKENERNIPTTLAGILRAALVGDKPVLPEATLYEHGVADWFQAVPAGKTLTDTSRQKELPQQDIVIRLAESPEWPTRGVEHRTPSQLEAGGKVDLRRELSLERSEALDRGSLIHAWFQTIEWLEDGEPDIAMLKHIADELGFLEVDVPVLIGQFQSMLQNPVVRTTLSRSTYQSPADKESASSVHIRPGVSQPQWQVWRERAFAIHEKEYILSGKFDRVVVFYDGERVVAADVLDYKTDIFPVNDPRILDIRVEIYRPQVEAYKRAIASLLGLNLQNISLDCFLLIMG